MRITISTTVAAPVEKVWKAWTNPEDIRVWNAASDAWHCPDAVSDLRPGGRFTYRMAARDGSAAFDFCGTFTRVVPHEVVEFSMDDERVVLVEFVAAENGVTVRETFDADSAHAAEMQRQGWQAILNRFARHVAAAV